MLYVKFENGKASAAQTDSEMRIWNGGDYARSLREGWRCRVEWHKKGFAYVEKIAAELTEATGVLYLGVDEGDHVSPRYDIVRAPQPGAVVSRGFNGDYYPCGTITRVSAAPCRLVTTQDENGVIRKFFRRRQTSAWVHNGTWGLVVGYRNERNPEF